MAGLYDEEFVARLTAGVVSLLPNWGMGAGAEVKLLTLSENATFIARAGEGQQPIIIRVHRPNYHSLAEIESELAWITALKADSDVIIPSIIPAQSGARVVEFNDQGQIRYVVASEFLAGAEPDASASLVAGFELLGATSARLHNHAKSWQPPAEFTRKAWDYNGAFGPNPIWGHWQDAIGLTPEGQKILEQAQAVLKSKLEAYGQDSTRYGIIHADLRLANLLMREAEIAVIDFDDTGFSWFMYDLASALSFHELNPMVPDLLTAWIKGYESISPLSAEDLAMIPSFIMYRRFAISAWIATHPETETAKEAGLEFHTAQTIEYAQSYLACHNDPDLFAIWRMREAA